MSKLKSYILNRFALKSSNYTSWLADCPFDCDVVEHYAPDWRVPADAGIIVTHMHYRWEEISALRRIYESTQIPILVLADGVLEYRNTWDNPTIADGAIFQPLIGHKLACIGPAQARTISSWDNANKCEVVGLPRLDHVVAGEYLPVRTQGPFRILITTANTPAFTAAQREKVVESLSLLRHRFNVNETVNGRPVEVTWRLTDGLEKEIGVPATNPPTEPRIPLSDAIELADAVITTPSTIYLESVLKRRPTAILDFNNSPAYVASAWTMSAPAHLNPTILELENPPHAKLHFQNSSLRDQLQIQTPARARLFKLMETMVAAGVAARQSGGPLRMPTNIIAKAFGNSNCLETDFDPISFYPENSSFRINEVNRLQLELSQAVARLEQLPRDLDQKDQDIASKDQDIINKDDHIEHLTRQLSDLLEKRKSDIAKKNEHIDSLVDLFETANQRVRKLRERYNEQAAIMSELKRQLKLSENPHPQDSKRHRAA